MAQLAFFSAGEPTNWRELWVTDGTANGTFMLKDIRPGARSGDPQGLTDLGNGKVLFRASIDGAYGLWSSDGTAEGTALIKDIWPAGNDWPQTFTPLGDGRALFLANDGIHGEELWVTDATAAGTALVKDLIPGASAISATKIVAVGNGHALVAAKISETISGGGTWQVWASDGTAAGTMLLLDNLDHTIGLESLGGGKGLVTRTSPNPDYVPLSPGSDPYVSFDRWISDGTAAGTAHVSAVVPAGTSVRTEFAGLGDGTALFNTSGGVWRTDGTLAGTAPASGVAAGDLELFRRFGSLGPRSGPDITGTLWGSLGDGRFVFVDHDDDSELKLWMFNGTSSSVIFDPDSPHISNLMPTGTGRVLFTSLHTAAENGSRPALYVTDGTAGGTFVLREDFDIPSGGSFTPAPYFAALGDGRVVFRGRAVDQNAPGAEGTELWVSDGTVAGTSRLQDIWPGAIGSDPGNFATLGYPDLVANTLALATASVPRGGSTTLSYRVANNGTGLAAPSSARIYLSTDATITAADTLLATVGAPQVVAKGHIVETPLIVLPAEIEPGRYWIGVVADSTGVVDESAENNNTSPAIPLEVLPPLTEGPDLRATILTSGATELLPGEQTTLSWRIANQGTLTALASTSKVYLSRTPTAQASDRVLATVTDPILIASDGIDNSATLTLPADIASGAWWIGVIADATAAINETDEANNTATGVAITIDDFAGGRSTTGTVGPGVATAGHIETKGDADWFRISLTSGTPYRFSIEGSPTGAGTLGNASLALRRENGDAIDGAFDEDGGAGTIGRLHYRPPSGGTHYLVVTGQAGSTGTYRLVAEETVGWVDIAAASIAEGNDGTRALQFTLTRTGGAAAFSVAYETRNATASAAAGDFVPAAGIVAFAAGEASRTIAITVSGDTTPEANEHFEIVLTGATGGFEIGTATASGTILDDDTVPAGSVSVGDIAIAEGNGGTVQAVFTLTRTGGTAPFTVAYATQDGTATVADGDYAAVSGTVSFGAGAVTQTIAVPVTGDTRVEPNESFTLVLSSPGNGAVLGQASAVAAIANDDNAVAPGAGSVSIAAASVVEGDTGTSLALFTVTRTGGSAAFTVDFASADGNARVVDGDYLAANGTLSFAAGEMARTIAVTVNGDTTAESDESFSMTLGATTGGATVGMFFATGTILDDDAAGTVSIAPVTVTEGNAGTAIATFTVTRSNGTAPFTVDYATFDGTGTAADGDYVPTSGTLSFAAGVDSMTIPVTVHGDMRFEGEENFQVLLSSPTNKANFGSQQALAFIANDDLALSVSALGADKPEGNAGGTSFTFTVTRHDDVAAPSSASYVVAGSGVRPANAVDFVGGALPSGTIGFAAGDASKTLTITVAGDKAVEWDETFSVQVASIAWGPGGGTSSATGVIRTDDGTPVLPALSIAATDASKSEGAGGGTTAFTFTVTRGGDATAAASVAWAVSGSGANPAMAADFPGGVLPGGTLGFAAGETSRTIVVAVNADSSPEQDEGFTVTLANPVEATLGSASAIGEIVSDDTPPVEDTLVSTPEDESLDAGDGNDMIVFSQGRDQYRVGILGNTIRVEGPDGRDEIRNVELLKFGDVAAITLESLRNQPTTDALYQNLEAGVLKFELPTRYVGPNPLDYVLPATLGDDVLQGTFRNDFANLGAGNDAASMGEGDDVFDGGGGSNFLTGGPGRDTFFIDGRDLVPVWSCITDWQAGEALTLWGWRAEVSQAAWAESDGLPGYLGATLFADIDGNGLVETAITWTGMTRGDLPTGLAFEVGGIGVLYFS